MATLYSVTEFTGNLKDDWADLIIVAVSLDSTMVDEDLSVLGDEEAAEREVAGGEVRHIERARPDVALALSNSGHYVGQICLKINIRLRILLLTVEVKFRL